jgi:hypothetical protein
MKRSSIDLFERISSDLDRLYCLFLRKGTESRLFAGLFKDSKRFPVWVPVVVGLSAGVTTVFVRIPLDFLNFEGFLQEIQIPDEQLPGSFVLNALYGFFRG